MEKKELETKAEQYKREMMQLYGRCCPTNSNGDTGSDDLVSVKKEEIFETVPVEDDVTETIEEESASASEIIENTEEAEEELPLSYIKEEAAAADDNDIDLRFPEPDLSELSADSDKYNEEINNPPSYPSEESIGNSHGFIRVNVRTGRDSGSVEGANVAVTATINGNRLILAAGKTDVSGTTRIFELPAPSEVYSQSPDPAVRPYSLFDVSVTADGFFNSISVDVPVFPGITSIQNFNMVPVPLLMNPSDETVVYYNQEPNFQEPVGEGG